MASLPDYRLSPEEYLARERQAAFKSEYLDGVSRAMAGGSERHNLITANLIAVLWAALRTGPCRVYPSDLRVKTPAARYFYPDVSVICGDTQYADDQADTVLNPTILVEVLSDSTAGYDRGTKFLAYQGIPSLQDYLLVSQDAPAVEHYLRQGNNAWLYTRTEGLDSSLQLLSIGCVLALRDIYMNIPIRDAT